MGKKLVITVLCFLLVLQGGGFVQAGALNSTQLVKTNAADDTNAPVLENFTVLPEYPAIGGTLTMTAKVSDESGVSRVTAILHNFTEKEFEMTLNQETGLWQVDIPIDSYALVGTWNLYVRMYDTVANNTLKSCDEFVDYIVISNQAHRDMDPPIIRSISLNPMPVVVEDPFTIRVKIEEEESGVASVEGELSDGKRDSAVTIPLSYDSNTDEWVATYTYPENTPLNEKYLFIKVRDGAGNFNQSGILFYPKSKYTDETPPDRPIVNEITDKDTVVTGQAEPGSIVKVWNNATIGTATTGIDGQFSVAIPAQPAHSRILVTAYDHAGNSSDSAILFVKDKTPPAKPIVNEVTDANEVLTGKAEPWGTVQVKIAGKLLDTTPVDGHGDFEFVFPWVNHTPLQPAGTELSVTALDREGNESEPTVVVVKDATPPKGPYIYLVTDQDTQISGWTDSVATIEVKADDVLLGSTTCEKNVTFSIPIPQQKAGTILKITATDLAGNVSVTQKTVLDRTPPEQPHVKKVTDQDTVVTGEAEAGSRIDVEGNTVLGTAITGTDGKFSVTIPRQEADTQLAIYAWDAAGNRSPIEYVRVADGTPPLPPVVNEVSDMDTVVNGKAEIYSTVEVKVNGVVIGSTMTYHDQFSVNIPSQPAGTELTITATDRLGNVSPAATVTVVKSKPVLMGWVEENGKMYYYDPVTHVKKTGWFTVGMSKYFFDLTTGTMQVGWMKEGATWYYFRDDGEMVTGWVLDRGTRYYLNSSGAMQTGWVKDGTGWFFFNNSGAMQTGWLKVGKVWYYLNSNGSMQTGWLWWGKGWYYFKGSGAMATGWAKVGATWYYFNSSGTMVTGWLKSGRQWYYLNSSGAMVTGWAKIAGKSYYFYSNGVLK
ncbi:glucan-binding YG repeat protein [Bacillus sp. SORGH_AS 510]|uniref:Ig-like domain-containing protein n=1 Tax=Bacillus sp. SORGH_AS_0510 TaxID=3041771 RepID=UPI002787CBCE|nr:Ig-like domain-containing protein [Bacillus sp. SORGH_AS_0510]MDQ1143723.1 glucan-binding YG repeat protein [Bacillus sp. SORGH_AS_0510]